MPKAAPLTPAKVIEYFKSSNLETADLVLSLVTAEVRSRKQKSQEAKAAQKKAKGSAPKGHGAAPAAPVESADPGAGEAQA